MTHSWTTNVLIDIKPVNKDLHSYYPVTKYQNNFISSTIHYLIQCSLYCKTIHIDENKKPLKTVLPDCKAAIKFQKTD